MYVGDRINLNFTLDEMILSRVSKDLKETQPIGNHFPSEEEFESNDFLSSDSEKEKKTELNFDLDEIIRKQQQSTSNDAQEKSEIGKIQILGNSQKKKGGQNTGKNKKKREMVSKILERWWYALEDWPPKNVNYLAMLKQRKLRLIRKEHWSNEPVFDCKRFEKVMKVTGYEGLFINNNGIIIDLRPMKSCPSFDNLLKKNIEELKEILVKAYSNQIKSLKVHTKKDKLLLKSLQKELDYYQRIN